MSQCDAKFDLIINVGHSGQNSGFASYLESYFIDDPLNFGIMNRV